jgi:hypothetical protein
MTRKIIFTRNIAFASLLALGVAGGAQARDFSVTNQGENFQVDYGTAAPNVAIGGAVTQTGNGESALYEHAPGASSQPGRIVRSVTGGGSSEILYWSLAMQAAPVGVPAR